MIQNECSTTPTSEHIHALSEEPIGLPSSRLPNGVIVYQASSEDIALNICKESQLQSKKAGLFSMQCFESGKVRPLYNPSNSSASTFWIGYSPVLGISGFLAGILCLSVLMTYSYRLVNARGMFTEKQNMDLEDSWQL